MLPIGSTTIGFPALPSAGSGVYSSSAPRGGAASEPLRRFAASCASPSWVLQASVEEPFTFIPHEPQIAARQEQRTASEPSSRSLACRMPSRTESEGSRSTLNSSQ
jgi:hypothetical protein